MNSELSSTAVSNNMGSEPVARSSRTNAAWRRYLPSLRTISIFIFYVFGQLVNGFFKPKKRGFFCNDTTIQYPVKDNTVGLGELVTIVLIVPWIVIRLLEAKLQLSIDKNRSRLQSRFMQGSIGSSPRSKAEEESLMQSSEGVKRCLVVNDGGDASVSDSTSQTGGVQASDKSTGDEVVLRRDDPVGVKFKISYAGADSEDQLSDAQIFHLGLSTCSFFTGLGKMACGRYRPHFMKQCRPDVECSLPENIHRYIEDYRCTNKLLSSYDLSYITSSWPSGHASLVFYSMLYLIYYMNTIIPATNHLGSKSRVLSKLSPLFVNSISVLMVSLATYVSMTRVSDYHHHPTDVLSGAVIGSVIAYAFAGHVLRPKIQSILREIK